MGRAGGRIAAADARSRKVKSRWEKEHVPARLSNSKERHLIGLQVISRKEFRSSSREGGGERENLRNDC